MLEEGGENGYKYTANILAPVKQARTVTIKVIISIIEGSIVQNSC
jgi:hypothetical protein